MRTLTLFSVLCLLTLPVVADDERQMLSTFDAVFNTQVQIMNLPETRPTDTQLSTPDLIWSLTTPRQVSYPQSAPQIRPLQWYDYPPVQYPTAYAQPVYYVAPYAQPAAPDVADWLFGTPRRPTAAQETVETATLEPEPTPLVDSTPLTKPSSVVSERSRTVQAGVIAASVIAPHTRQVEERDPTTAAIPEMPMWEIINYWTRKILLTGVLLGIGAFAWYKEHAAKHQASRRLADLEQEMQRLDRLIYGDDRKGKDTP